MRFRSRGPPGSSVRWSYHTSHAHRGVDPDDRRQTAACRAYGEDRRWRFPAHDRRKRLADHHGGRCRWSGWAGTGPAPLALTQGLRACAGVVPVLMSSRPAALACPPLAGHCIWNSNAKLMRLARSFRPNPWRRALRNDDVEGGRACPRTRDTPPWRYSSSNARRRPSSIVWQRKGFVGKSQEGPALPDLRSSKVQPYPKPRVIDGAFAIASSNLYLLNVLCDRYSGSESWRWLL